MRRLCVKCGLDTEGMNVEDPGDYIELELTEKDTECISGTVLMYVCEDCFRDYMVQAGYYECGRCDRWCNELLSVCVDAGCHTQRNGDPGWPPEYEDMCGECSDKHSGRSEGPEQEDM